MAAPLSEPTAAWLMEPLRLGCRADIPKVVETAVACLHKLVAYSYLQDESTRSGRLDDQTIVSQVCSALSFIQCGGGPTLAVL